MSGTGGSDLGGGNVNLVCPTDVSVGMTVSATTMLSLVTQIDASNTIAGTVSASYFRDYLRWQEDGNGTSTFSVSGANQTTFRNAIASVLDGSLTVNGTGTGYAAQLAATDSVNGITFKQHVVSHIAYVLLGHAQNRFAIINDQALEDDISINQIADNYVTNLGTGQTGDGRALLEQLMHWDVISNSGSRFKSSEGIDGYAAQGDKAIPFMSGDQVWFRLAVHGTGTNGVFESTAVPSTNADTGVTYDSDFTDNTPAQWLIKITLN